MVEELQSRSRLKKSLITVAVIALLAAGAVGFGGIFDEESAAIASFPVQEGEFVITLTLRSGELEAVKAEQIVSPRVDGRLKITHLFPEGDVVEIGDLVIEFERADFEKRVTEAEQGLEAAKAELTQTDANQRVEISRQESDIENRKAQFRLAELQVERMKFEADLAKREAELQARQAELSLEQSVKKLAGQRIVDGAVRMKAELEVSQKERDLEKARKDLESLTIYAEEPGLVVYGKIWKGARPEKIRVGDEPWGGQSLITLPDLSGMQVKTFVNEVDVDKLDVDQKVTIKLDALPDPTFHGSITSIASLGHEKEGDKNVKVFDVTIIIDEEDERLKPGMSATSTVVIETVPAPPAPLEAEDVVEEPRELVSLPLYIPIDAVFVKSGHTFVYRIDGGASVQQEVTLGQRNENYVIVEEGLGKDDRVALRDPTLVLEELGGIPQDEPEGEQADGDGETL